MRILLMNPPAEHTPREYENLHDPDDHGLLDTEDFGLFPPLGLLYILSALKEKTPEHESLFLDCIAEKLDHQSLAKRIAAIRPDIVGITSFTVSLYDVCLAARTVRSLCPGVHLCLGGHHPLAFPFEAAALPEFDSIIVGEGEDAFPELVRALAAGTDFTGICGVYTAASIERFRGDRCGDQRFLSGLGVPAAYVDDIDRLRFPDRDAIKHLAYRSIVGVSSRLATMITSRGCPFRCSYCDVPYKLYRQRSINSVVDEVGVCLEMGYEEIHFYDDLFNITPERVIAFSEEVLRRGYRFIWDFRGRVNLVTLESLTMARAAGCRMISFGVETGSDEGLRQMKKNCTTAEIRQVFKWCRSLGILTIADFMIGLPFEKSGADVHRNIDFMLALDPDYAQVSILSLFPNTELFELAAARGLINSERWRTFVLAPTPVFQFDHWLESLSMSELLSLQKEAYRRFYFRPRYIWRSLLATASWHEFMAKLQGVLKLLR